MPTLLEKIQANANARLTLPPNVMPRQELERYRKFLKVETHRLRILHRSGVGGREVCKARASLMDVLLTKMIEAEIASSPMLARIPTPVFALVAIGGYGRAELNPHSDVDIMFLHDGDPLTRSRGTPALESLVECVLYSLWDLGFKVGHSVRSVADCIEMANKDMQSKTALIEARRILGDAPLFDRFERVLLAKSVIGREQDYIQARLEDQDARRTKYGNSACMLEPNIKNGCGGLRDYQNLLWMAYFKYRTRTLAELEIKEMVSPAESKQLDSAYDFLLRVRTELHYLVNHSTDILPRSMQASVAANLGYHERHPGKRLELFMRDFYVHSRNIDLITRMVERRLALVPKPRQRTRLRELFRTSPPETAPQLVDGFRFQDGEIYPASKNVFRDSPRRLMRVFLYAQQRGLKLHPDLAQLIRSQLSLVNNDFMADDHVSQTFFEILDQRGSVAPVLRAMHEVGFLGKFIPEFGRLTCLVQREFYHQYTADEHTLMCIQMLDQIWNSKIPPYAAYAEIFRTVECPYVLYLALLLHDAGKAARSAGHHEEIGAQLALRVSKRLKLDGAKAHTLRLLIENHLAMVLISQRRDLDDPNVIRNFARQIQSAENLVLLTLHTFADTLGTSSQLWNGFKDATLWRLYRKTRQVLTGATEFLIVEARQKELLAEEVQKLAPPTFDPSEVQAHFHNVPARYCQINEPREILRDVTQVHRFIRLQLTDKEENALVPIITWHNEPDRGYTNVTVCTWDRERLFSNITGCLTASGLNILGAEILSRNDGIILDTFFVTDARTGLLTTREERDRFEDLLGKVLTGVHVDLSALIVRTKSAPSPFKMIDGDQIPTLINLDNSLSETRSIIDIQTEDRLGLLYDISRALTAANVNISLAKILTEKGAAVDSFYVTEQNGAKIAEGERESAIKNKLRHAIQNRA